MRQSVSLIPLQCPSCETPVAAGIGEHAWKCSQCSQGIQLNAERMLKEIIITYQQAALDNVIGYPYWVVEVDVRLERETLQGNRNEEMNQFWENPRNFFIPAFEMDLTDRLQKAVTLLKSPPLLIAVESYNFRPVVMAAQDLKAYVEFIVLQVEAERRDDLNHLVFDLQLSEAQLWVLPE